MSELKDLTKSLYDRVNEHKERPEALAAFANMLNASRVFLEKARELKDDEQFFTAVEMETLERMTNETTVSKDWSV